MQVELTWRDEDGMIHDARLNRVSKIEEKDNILNIWHDMLSVEKVYLVHINDIESFSVYLGD